MSEKEKSIEPYDMDGPTFDSDKYLQKVLKVINFYTIFLIPYAPFIL